MPCSKKIQNNKDV